VNGADPVTTPRTGTTPGNHGYLRGVRGGGLHESIDDQGEIGDHAQSTHCKLLRIATQSASRYHPVQRSTRVVTVIRTRGEITIQRGVYTNLPVDMERHSIMATNSVSPDG
jgi:hypothetical protein